MSFCIERPKRKIAGNARFAALGYDVDHAAGGIAVHHREGTAQYLDALRGAEVEMRHLALAVGKARRDAVGNQAQAPDAEGRTPAEAARGDLQILGVVLPVLHHDARHPAERFRQVDHRPGPPDILRLDTVDGGRHLHARPLHARAGDGNGVDRRLSQRDCRSDESEHRKQSHTALQRSDFQTSPSRQRCRLH